MKRKTDGSIISKLIITIVLSSIPLVLVAGHSAAYQDRTPDLKTKLLGTWFLVSMENDKKVRVLGSTILAA